LPPTRSSALTASTLPSFGGELAEPTCTDDPQQIEEVAAWRSLYDGIDRLWLDSGPYEVWAREQLSSWHSAINIRGYAIAQRINDTRRCYYWLFRDQSDECAAPTRCSRCDHEFSNYGGSVIKQLVCEPCAIVTAA